MKSNIVVLEHENGRVLVLPFDDADEPEDVVSEYADVLKFRLSSVDWSVTKTPRIEIYTGDELTNTGV